jgi:copper transport protein
VKVLLKFLLLVLVTLQIIFSYTITSAHGFIVRAVPENRAVLDRAPTRLQYWFSEGLEVAFSSVNVRDQNGQIIASGGVDTDNSALMRVALPPDLPPGAYIVELRPAFASDGHVFAETQVFFVGEPGESAESAAGLVTAGTTNALPLEVLWRAVMYAATMLLFGVFTLYAGVLLPAWGSPAYPAGSLPPRVMRRLSIMIGVGLALAVLSNLVGLLQQSMAFFNVGADVVLRESLWSVVRIGSRFGDVWNFRMAMLLLAAGLFAAGLYYRDSQPGTVRAFWTANAWVLALVAGSFSVVSHAAGSLLLPWVGIAVDWLHTVGVGFWVGGLTALVLVLPVALAPYQGEVRRQALLAALRRYSRVALGAALIVIASGVYSALTWVDAPADLTGTNFGLSLLLKVGMVGGLLALGGIHHLMANPERFRGLSALRRLLNHRPLLTLRLEVVFALLVLCAAALLTATPVPVPDFVQTQVPAPRASQTVGDLVIAHSITPGGPGTNSYEVSVTTRDGQPVEGVSVTIQHVYPALDLRPDAQTADPTGGGIYVAADGALDRPGEWWTLVDVRTPDGAATRAAFRSTIRAEAAIIQSQPPGVQHLAALGVICAVLVWVSLPMLTRWTRQLDLSPSSVAVAVGATGATVLFLLFGFVLLQQTSQQYQARILPAPEEVNAVLPDAASLERGQALYRAYCAAWEAQPDAWAVLQTRISQASDFELYTIVREGYRGLPACAGEADITDDQRWDVVNYLRAYVSA